MKYIPSREAANSEEQVLSFEVANLASLCKPAIHTTSCTVISMMMEPVPI